MGKTSVEIDLDIADQAAEILGTTTLRDTIHASLLEIVNVRRRLELVTLLSEPGRYDFDSVVVSKQAWDEFAALLDAPVGRTPKLAALLSEPTVFDTAE